MEDIKLDWYTEFPDRFLDLEPHEIREVFPNPSLIYIEGQEKAPLFLSVLLHGNELSSFYVARKIANHLKTHKLHRSLIVFIGNVWACEKNQRFNNDQLDYNRIWSEGDSREHHLAQRVLKKVEELGPLYASIDIHNNTGVNPVYSCINSLESESIYLASLFSRTIVYFTNPNTVQSVAFSKLAPSVTIECGLSGDRYGIERAYQFVLDVLHLHDFDHDTHHLDVDIYHTVARMKIPQNLSFSFSQLPANIIFAKHFEKMNFTPLEPGYTIANIHTSETPLHLLDDNNQDHFDTYFSRSGQDLKLKKKVIPSMLTKNQQVIRQDCLGYLMEELPASMWKKKTKKRSAS